MTLPVSIPLNPAIDRSVLRDGRARFREWVNALNAASGGNLPDARPSEQFFTPLPAEPPAEPPATGAPLHLEARLDAVQVIVVPGYLNECGAFLANCLTDGLAHLQTLGAGTSIAPMAGRGGCRENARRLRDHILGKRAHRPRSAQPPLTLLVPMSKGAADTMEMLALYPDMADHIDAVASLAGCVCGSPLQGMAPDWLKWLERVLPLPTCARFGGAAVDSLSPATRAAFLADFQMPATVRNYSLGAVVDDAGVSAALRPLHRALARIDPLNDGQMLLGDQILPGATFLGALNCDHVASAMPFNRNRGLLARLITARFLTHNAFPREIMLEAMVRYVIEDLRT